MERSSLDYLNCIVFFFFPTSSSQKSPVKSPRKCDKKSEKKSEKKKKKKKTKDHAAAAPNVGLDLLHQHTEDRLKGLDAEQRKNIYNFEVCFTFSTPCIS